VRTIYVGIFVSIAFWGAAPANAQTSASFRLTESGFNAGGDPFQGVVLSSASFRLTIDSIGEGFLGASLASAGYRADVGFVAAYPPPGEVQNLRFTSHTRMTWSPERSTGSYTVYRGGTSLATGVTTPYFDDPTNPAPGAGYFYLVTARNRLGEEGP
jgi:hypothetical protein